MPNAAMDIRSTPVLTFRWIVFALALGYSIYHIGWNGYENWGGPFRFLTFWGLFFSTFAAARMLATSLGRDDDSHLPIAATAAVINTMVLFLYWRLYLIDPFLVHEKGDPGAWWNNYYLHGLGPLVQIFDALFIARAFRAPLRAVLPILAFVLAFVVFGELVVQTFSSTPAGSVTNGLPYPFLNNMELGDRIIYYATNAGVALGILALFSAIAWVIRRFLPKAM